jgi:hypothetical protein
MPGQARMAASTAQVPLFALFAREALPKQNATNPNNAKGGTTNAEA